MACSYRRIGIEVAALEAGKLGADQRGMVLEVLRAARGPDLELLVVRRQAFPLRHLLIGSMRLDGINRPR